MQHTQVCQCRISSHIASLSQWELVSELELKFHLSFSFPLSSPLSWMVSHCTAQAGLKIMRHGCPVSASRAPGMIGMHCHLWLRGSFGCSSAFVCSRHAGVWLCWGTDVEVFNAHASHRWVSIHQALVIMFQALGLFVNLGVIPDSFTPSQHQPTYQSGWEMFPKYSLYLAPLVFFLLLLLYPLLLSSTSKMTFDIIFCFHANTLFNGGDL